MDYMLVSKCECGVVISSMSISEERFIALAEKMRNLNDCLGDEAGHVGNRTITSYSSLCLDCGKDKETT